MRVKALVELSGSTIFLKPDEEAEFPEDEALRLIAARFAVPVIEDARPKIERAVSRKTREKR